MDSYTDKKKIPTDIIIASFRGELTDSGKASLDEWLSSEVNKEKYEALRRVWDSTVANAGEFDSDKSYRRLRNRISNVWKHIAVASSAAAVAVIGFTLFNICGQQDEPVLAQTCACVTGKSSVILPDGSKIVLHKGASLSYDSSFSSTNRAVSLDGEAYFEVAKDSENTFTVNVDDNELELHLDASTEVASGYFPAKGDKVRLLYSKYDMVLKQIDILQKAAPEEGSGE